MLNPIFDRETISNEQTREYVKEDKKQTPVTVDDYNCCIFCDLNFICCCLFT
jgi:hypothetical protein